MDGNKLLKVIKYLKYGLGLTAAVFCLYLVLKSPTGVAFAVETEGSGFGISTYPESSFLNAPNIAPGDRASAGLTVKNEGEYDFTYNIAAQLENADALLYDVLDLELRDNQNNILYAGKLKDLNSLVLGVLGAQGSCDFTFTVGFPVECGNEYQGKAASVKFVLNAQEHPPYIEGGQIVWDPPLEKPDVHVRRGMVMPISFHLIKDGTYDTVKRGIDLVITGIDDRGNPAEYVFRASDGTLEWEEHGLNKPHYSLKFDTEKYPVQNDTYYTAVVKYGDQVLGSTKFVSGK